MPRSSHAKVGLRRPIGDEKLSFGAKLGLWLAAIVLVLFCTNLAIIEITKPDSRPITAQEYVEHKYNIRAGQHYPLIAGKVKLLPPRLSDLTGPSTPVLPVEYYDDYKAYDIAVPVSDITPHFKEGAMRAFTFTFCDTDSGLVLPKKSHVEFGYGFLPFFHSVDDGPYTSLAQAIDEADPNKVRVSLDTSIKKMDIFISRANFNKLMGNWADAGPQQQKESACK